MNRPDAEMTVLAIFNDDQYMTSAKRSDFRVIAEHGHRTHRMHETNTGDSVGGFLCKNFY